jgi:hypothetical protein
MHPPTTAVTDTGRVPFMKRIAAVLTLVGATLGLAAPSALAAAPSLCVNAHIDVNGTVQDVNQCLPG